MSDTDKDNCEKTKSPSTDSDDDLRQLLDLASAEDVQISLADQGLDSPNTQDSTGGFHSSYQNVDNFDQLKELLKKESSNIQRTPEMATLPQPSSDQDLMKYLVNTSTATVNSSDTITVNLKCNTTLVTTMVTSVLSTTSPITSRLTSVTSHLSPVTSYTTAPVASHMSHNSTSTSSYDHGLPKHQDNWDDLFAELDPLSNEKV